MGRTGHCGENRKAINRRANNEAISRTGGIAPFSPGNRRHEQGDEKLSVLSNDGFCRCTHGVRHNHFGLGHGFMGRTNNLIAVPGHTPAMPIRPANRSVNLTTEIRINHLERASEPIGPPGKRPPPNPKRLAQPLPQIALDPLPAQNHCQEYKHCDDARNKREIAQGDEIFEDHATWPNDPATRPARSMDCNCDAMARFAGRVVMSHPFFGPQAREPCLPLPKRLLRPQQSKPSPSLATVGLLPSQ